MPLLSPVFIVCRQHRLRRSSCRVYRDTAVEINGILHGAAKDDRWVRKLLDDRDAVATGAMARVFLNRDDDDNCWIVLVMDTEMYNQARKR